MPAKTKRQQRFMGACSNPKTRRRMGAKCPPVDVAKEFARTPGPKTKRRTKKRTTK